LVAVRDQVIAGRYELQHVVGTGGMSTVYCAHDTLLERYVALKILHEHYGGDEEYVERFRREARAVAQLSHPNIVTVIDRGEEDGRQYIVFELIEGDNLKDLVSRGGPLPVRRVLELGLEIGRALAFAHAQGLVHRDVKPQNVLLNGDGRAKVTDFGIVRSLDAVGGHTQTGTVLGTSHYIAPEQARGEHVDAQTDVYSFGVVLYELLVGDVPYPGESFLSVAMKHVNEPVPSVLDRRPDAPIRLATLVERCMAKDPVDRPASMNEVVSELESVVAELEGREGGEGTMIMRKPPVVRPRQPRAHRDRRIPVWPLLALVLIALVVGGAVYALRDDGQQPGGATASAAIELEGIGAWDPDGPGDGEHDEDAPLATDGDETTYWPTSTYQASLSAIGKSGVGVIVDAGEARELSQLAVTTDTPGFTAEIRAGGSAEGPFETVVGASKTVEGTTVWDLEGAEARYYVVWITELDSVAHVNEVKAT
jgi:eukaryotic-like serine/threonine-protein kinase